MSQPRSIVLTVTEFDGANSRNANQMYLNHPGFFLTTTDVRYAGR